MQFKFVKNTTEALKKNKRTGLDGNQTGTVVWRIEQALKLSEETPVVRDILEKVLVTATEVNHRIVNSVCDVLAARAEGPVPFKPAHDLSQGSYD